MKRRGQGQEFAVIGLGRFGSSLALTLIEQGYEVLGIDIDPAIVQHYADDLTHTVRMDATNEDALRAIDISTIDTVVVSMAEHFENSIMATSVLKSLGVRCVVCKALTLRQAEILRRVGADRVVLPEHEAGQRLALELIKPQMLDSMVLGPDHTVAEVSLPDRLIGRSLSNSQLQDSSGLIVLLIKSGSDLIVHPPAGHIFKRGDLLIVVGSKAAVSSFS